jgi:small-conductance mechanosensitive channel
MAFPSLPQIVLALGLLILGLGIGVVVEKLIQSWIERWAEDTPWRGDNIIVRALRGMPIFWGLAAGSFMATYTIDRDEYALIFSQLQNFISAILLGSVTIFAARLASGFIRTYSGKEDTVLPSTSLVPLLVRLSIYVIGVLMIISVLGFEITPILTGIGVGGVAVALGLQDTLSNVFAGVYLIAARQVTPGDYVRLEEGQEGEVQDINWRSASLETLEKTTVVVPNSKLASATVTNYHRRGHTSQVRVAVGVAYDSDMEHVERVTKEVAREVASELTPGGDDYEPRMFYQAFGEFSVNFIVFLRATSYYNRYEVRHAFLKRLIARYDEEGIEIPFPIREFGMELSTGGLEHGHLAPARASENPFSGDAPAPRDE